MIITRTNKFKNLTVHQKSKRLYDLHEFSLKILAEVRKKEISWKVLEYPEGYRLREPGSPKS